jgi:hypothetical protein
MKIIFFVTLTFLSNCNAENLKKIFLNEQSYAKKLLDVEYKEFKKNKISFAIPRIKQSDTFFDKLNYDINNTANELKKTLNIDCENKGYGELSYRVIDLSEHFISLIKQTAYSSCYGREVYDEQYINIWKFKNKFYSIKLSNKMMQNDFDWKSYDQECEESNTNKEFRVLSVEKGKLYMYISKGKTCTTKIKVEHVSDNILVKALKNNMGFENIYFF